MEMGEGEADILSDPFLTSPIKREVTTEEFYSLNIKTKKTVFSKRFGGFLPVVMDVETSGLNPQTDGLLELAAVTLQMDEKGELRPDQTIAYAIEPFNGANRDPEALAITGIDPDEPLRYAVTEQQALHHLFIKIHKAVQEAGCRRAVLVGHNVWFDLAFLQAAIKRCPALHSPFHSFTTLDTATLSAVALGQTVLARAMKAARIPFDVDQAHSAIYDAQKTADLFCLIVNRLRR